MSGTSNDSIVPKLSRKKIETLANDLLEKVCPAILVRPNQTPLITIVEYLQSQYSVSFNFDKELGEDSSGRMICGLCRFNPPEILINRDHFESMRFQFTLSHEIGHFILHRNIKLNKEEYQDGALVDPEIDWASGKKKLITARDWIEWQANCFASSLLLPKGPFLIVITGIQYHIGINRNFGYIYLTDARSIHDLKEIKRLASNIFSVSETVIENRLKDLDRIKDCRKSKMEHSSQIDLVGEVKKSAN